MSLLNGACTSTLLTTPLTRHARLFRVIKRQQLPRLRVGAVRATGEGISVTSTDERLKKGIAEFYDESSGIWENIWGEHMHHGFYDPNAVVQISDHRSAQISMIEQALLFAAVPGIAQLLSLVLSIIHLILNLILHFSHSLLES